MKYQTIPLVAFSMMLMLPGTVEADDTPEFTRNGHTTDSLQKVKQAVEQDKAVLLDVRERDEWNAGHLSAARLLPLSAIREGELTEEQQKLLPKDKPIYCHCRSGGRVLVVSRLLRSDGYDIRPLKSGYLDLLKAGFEKAKAKAE